MTHSRPKKRFTLLKHETEDDVHVDFLLENEQETLWTWRINDVEFFSQPAENRSISAVRIFDHRKLYLDFEGELSGSRGRVMQIDTGTWQFVRQNKNRLVIETDSHLFSGTWSFLFPENPENHVGTDVPADVGFPESDLGVWTLVWNRLSRRHAG